MDLSSEGLPAEQRGRHKFGLTAKQLPDGTHSEQDARDWLCAACGVTSRAELDHRPKAAATLRTIQQRYHHWKRRSRT